METLGFDFGIFGAGWGKRRGEGGEGGGLSLGLGWRCDRAFPLFFFLWEREKERVIKEEDETVWDGHLGLGKRTMTSFTNFFYYYFISHA
jgi:hypothetical protein